MKFWRTLFEESVDALAAIRGLETFQLLFDLIVEGFLKFQFAAAE